MLLCCSWKWISKRVLTGWDVKGESNVVQNVGWWRLGDISIRVVIRTACAIEMAVLIV